ncbi:hypothetical protein M434DRAFT_388481 [Hypoxylon sp. CO27-5]|nr:hypothetical protein M434DRAFT_388481 [Hypoxylon sp. CO27-5]
MADDDRAYYIRPGHVITTAVALSVMDIAAVALRFWVRRIQRQPSKADDWLMVPAALATVGICLSQVYAVSQKALAYSVEIPPDFTGSISGLITPQLALKAQASIHNVCEIWNSQRQFMMKCSQTVNIVLTLCITDFVTDIFIFLIPIPLVLQLQLSTSKKLSVCSMFLLGGLVTACMYWGMVECGVGVFAACLPTIQFLFRKFIWEPAASPIKRMFSSRPSRSSETPKHSIYVDRSFNVAYVEVDSTSSRAASPAYISTIANERPMNRWYHVRDDVVGAAR